MRRDPEHRHHGRPSGRGRANRHDGGRRAQQRRRGGCERARHRADRHAGAGGRPRALQRRTGGADRRRDAVGGELAASLVELDIEEQPGVFEVDAALAPGAPHVHADGNRFVEWRFCNGDPDGAMRRADVVVDETYRTQHVDHAYLEPEAGVGWFDGDGVLTLRVSTQVIEHARTIADILAFPHGRVRVIGAYMGGGFGGKEDMTVEPYLALLTWKTRKPVRMVWTRQESLQARPEAASVHDALPHRCDARRTHRRAGHLDRRQCRRVSAASARGCCSPGPPIRSARTGATTSAPRASPSSPTRCPTAPSGGSVRCRSCSRTSCKWTGSPS